MMQSVKQVRQFIDRYDPFQAKEDDDSKEPKTYTLEGTFSQTLIQQTDQTQKDRNKNDQKQMKDEEMWKNGCIIEDKKEGNQTENIVTGEGIKEEINKVNKKVLARRPKAYQTQKSFYMKQKILLSRRGDKRILRQRKIKKSKKKQKKDDKVSKVVIQKYGNKNENKQKIKVKETKKICKKLLQPKQKLVFDLYIFSASLPNLIMGRTDLNQFSRLKLERLKLRMFVKK